MNLQKLELYFQKLQLFQKITVSKPVLYSHSRKNKQEKRKEGRRGREKREGGGGGGGGGGGEEEIKWEKMEKAGL